MTRFATPLFLAALLAMRWNQAKRNVHGCRQTGGVHHHRAIRSQKEKEPCKG
jgi:hypothetical protein